MAHLIDRRLNDRGRSSVNRERFLRRYKSHVQEAVRRMVGERKLSDLEQGGEVRVPRKDVSEPSFNYGRVGDREHVLPGNREYVAGDRIPRPEGGGGGGGSNSDGGEGESQDDFVFQLSREEFMQIFFDDLELPRLARTEFGPSNTFKSIRHGFAKTGVPANLAVVRTMTQALARRIALTGALAREAMGLEEEFATATAIGHAELAARLHARLQRIERRQDAIPFLDDPDMRFRNRVLRPEPIARAVMFCLMDVSASMDETKKDLAKRFFALLYMFLTRKYQQVDLVFIRHTDDAEEVDEDTFFHDTRSGGTVVFSALELADKIRKERYAHGWNVYAAQASDGDAFGADPARSSRFLREQLLPPLRYYTYLELVPDTSDTRPSTLWAEYERVAEQTVTFAMRRAASRDQIYPVFRELFRKEASS
ncbi:MAG TPA: YeaH/YhbH family protein [Casimicrobiaceae bacterium]|nr:YeaH/YhbH family protein [Casimicrobiaceae bacterium]